jgi:hypothetical protein
VARFALIAALLWGCSPAPSNRPDSDVVVAEVDGASVALKDVKNEILSMRGYTPSLEARGPSRGEVSEAVRRAIERTVVLREGQRRGVTLPAGSLEEEVMRFRADFPPGGLEKALLQAGMEPDAWREQLRRSLLYRRSADAIAAAGATVTPQEVEAEFRKERNLATVPERVRVRQYLFDSAERAAAAREKLQDGRPVGGDVGVLHDGGRPVGGALLREGRASGDRGDVPEASRGARRGSRASACHAGVFDGRLRRTDGRL